MGLAIRAIFIVGMPVMGVMHMGVFMIQFLVFMVVFVMLRQVQPDAEKHQSRGHAEPEGEALTEQDEAQKGADKRRHGKVGPGSGYPDVAQGPHKEHQAGAVSEKSQ